MTNRSSLAGLEPADRQFRFHLVLQPPDRPTPQIQSTDYNVPTDSNCSSGTRQMAGLPKAYFSHALRELCIGEESIMTGD